VILRSGLTARAWAPVSTSDLAATPDLETMPGLDAMLGLDPALGLVTARPTANR